MEGQNEDLKDKNAQLQTQYEQLKSTHEMAVRETAELRDQFHQQETAMDDLQAAAAKANSANAELAIQKATIDALEAKIETLEVDLQV